MARLEVGGGAGLRPAPENLLCVAFGHEARTSACGALQGLSFGGAVGSMFWPVDRVKGMSRLRLGGHALDPAARPESRLVPPPKGGEAEAR